MGEFKPQTIDLLGDKTSFCDTTKDPLHSGLEAMEDSARIRYCQRHYALVPSLDKIGLPQPGQQFRLVTRRTFNAIHFLEYIAAREIITDLHIAIYSINYFAAEMLVQMITEGKIRRAQVLMSNLRNKGHREKEEAVNKMMVGHPAISLFFCCSHAKTFSCATNAGNFYTCEGSGNLAYNSRVEQYVIDNDRGMYEFTIQWMAEIKTFLAGKKELEIC